MQAIALAEPSAVGSMDGVRVVVAVEEDDNAMPFECPRGEADGVDRAEPGVGDEDNEVR